ncbi:MAG: SurA N-terminal domain-containing protein [Burkholderiaceae bacterium]
MFDSIRKHMKIMQILLFLLIVPSFVLFGIDGYSRFKDQGEAVAMVDGQAIRQGEWDTAHKSEVERVRSSMPSLDPKLLDSPEAKYATLERLVRDKVMQAAASKFKFTASDQRLARDLHDNPSIAALRKPDGSLDMERYRQLVGAQGMSPEMFEARVRGDISTRQVIEGIGATGITTPAVADVALNAFFERREVQIARFNTVDFASKVSLTDAQVEQYYKDNPSLFQAPEQASIEYVVLDVESIRKTIVPNPDEVKTYFEQNAARLSGQEERRASHILIASPKTAPAAERQAAKAKADELLAQVQKAPDSFAEVAKKNSQDPGSAANGGDLDFFANGAMVKPFSDAAFAMKKGDISPVVETEFGYHIIRLTDIKVPKQKTLEEMRPEIETELKKQQAQKKFAESADSFTNGVYEQSDSFKAIAERLKLEVKTASNVQRKAAPDATGVLTNTKFLNALFTPDAVDKKRNTEAVEIGSNQLASGRIVQYTPARTLPFEQVKDKAREKLLAVQGADLARKEGMAKLAAWQAAPGSASLAEAVVIARDQSQKLPAAMIDAALRADSSKLPAFVGVNLNDQGYAVIKVNKLLEREAKADSAKQDRQQYTQWWTNAEAMAYYNGLKERFKAEIKVTKPVVKKDDVVAQQ